MFLYFKRREKRGKREAPRPPRSGRTSRRSPGKRNAGSSSRSRRGISPPASGRSWRAHPRTHAPRSLHVCGARPRRSRRPPGAEGRIFKPRKRCSKPRGAKISGSSPILAAGGTAWRSSSSADLRRRRACGAANKANTSEPPRTHFFQIPPLAFFGTLW